jgi:hypothetical protein
MAAQVAGLAELEFYSGGKGRAAAWKAASSPEKRYGEKPKILLYQHRLLSVLSWLTAARAMNASQKAGGVGMNNRRAGGKARAGGRMKKTVWC